jgi:hypothetical protein
MGDVSSTEKILKEKYKLWRGGRVSLVLLGSPVLSCGKHTVLEIQCSAGDISTSCHCNHDNE